MSWPLSQDYNEAIQDPRSGFADPELRDGQPTTNALGLPLPRSGNFADVYEFHCPRHKTRWAIKCFTRKVAGLRERYAEVSKFLQQARLPFTVAFQYLEEGIRVRGQFYPILKMRWVEGLLLNEFVRDNLGKPALLQSLGLIWQRMAKRLREVGIAHADLQHGNVLLVPGPNAQSLSVRLIDYDGMFVPSLAGRKSGEVGHPNYQHPQRLQEGTYSGEVDRVPLLVVATALRALSVGRRELWERYDNGDNLLFKETDLRAPAESELFHELAAMPEPVGTLAERLAEACAARLEEAPLLEELLPGGKPGGKVTARPSSGVTADLLAGLMDGEEADGGATAATAEPAEESERLDEVANWDFDEEPAPPRPRKKSRKKRRKQAGVPRWAWAAGGVAALVLLLLGILIATRGGRDKENGPAVAENRPEASPRDRGTKTDKQPPKDRQGTPSKDKVKPPDGGVKPPDNGVKPPDRGIKPPDNGLTPVVVEDGPITPVDRQGVRLLDKPALRCAVSPDGQVLAVYRAFPTGIDLWDLPSGKPLTPINYQPTTIPTGMSFSSDGKTLYTATPGEGTRAWDVARGVALGDTQPGEYVMGTGQYRADVGRENKVGNAFLRLWRRDSAEEYYRHPLRAIGHISFSVSRDESRLAFLIDGENVQVLDPRSKRPIARFNVLVERQSGAAHISPDGKTVLISYHDKVLRLWDIEGQKVLRSFTGHIYLLTAQAFSPGGRWACSGDAGGVVRIWEVATGKLLATLTGPRRPVRGLAMASSGRLVAVAEDGAFMWELNKNASPAVEVEKPRPAPVVRGQLRRLEGQVASARSLGFSPDGRLLAVGHETGSLRLWDVKAGKELHSFERLGGRVTSVAFSADGARVSANANIQGVRTWEVESKRPVGKRIPGYDISPRARFRASVELAGPRFQPTLRLWKEAYTREFVRFSVNDNTNVTVSFSADSWRVAFLGRRGVLYVFDLLKRMPVAKFSVQVNRSSQAACIAPDGKSVLVSYPSGELRLWDLATQKPGQPFTAHAGLVRALAFSPDGKLAFSGDDRGAVHVWEAATARHLAAFTGATQRIEQLAASPDGRQLGAVTPEGVFLWELGDLAGPPPSQPVVPSTPASKDITFSDFLQVPGGVSGLACDRHGRWLLVSDQNKAIGIYDFDRRKREHTFAPADGVEGQRLALLDERRMLCVPRDGVLQMVNVAAGTVERRFEPAIPDTNVLRTSPDGRLALTGGGVAKPDGGANCELSLWDIAAGKRLGVWQGHTQPVHDVRFSLDSSYAVSCGGDGIRVWEVPGGKALKHVATPALTVAAVSPDCRFVATSIGDENLTIWDVRKGIKLRQLAARKGRVNCLAFTSRGDRILVGCRGNRTVAPGAPASPDPAQCVVWIWDVGTGQELACCKAHRGDVRTVIACETDYFMLTTSLDGTVRRWGLSGLVLPEKPAPEGPVSEPATVLPHPRWIGAIAVSADSQQLLSADTTATVTLWDLKTRKKKRSFPKISIFQRKMAFLPGGRQMVCAPGDNVLQVVSLATGQVVRRLGPVPRSALFVRTSADGRLAVVAGTQATFKDGRHIPVDCNVYLWDIKTGKLLKTWVGHTAGVGDARFLPGGRRVVSIGEDGVRFWDVSRDKQVRFLPISAGGASTLSPDGRLLATGAGDKSPITIWNLETASEVVRLSGRKGQLSCLAFNASGDRLLSANHGSLAAPQPGQRFKGDPDVCVVRLWDLKTGQELRRFKGHIEFIAGLAFTPDGRLAISYCHDETVRLWDLSGGGKP